MRIIFAVAVVFLLNISSIMNAEGINKQVIAGAGPSTVVAQLFAKEFSRLPDVKEYKFTVIKKSYKHAGGIKWSDKNLFGRTGRPLNDEEKRMNKEEIFLARMPIAFATGSGTGVTSLTLEQLEGIYRHKITNWSQVGGVNEEIFLVGREPTEALFSELKKQYPFFNEVLFHQTVKTDDYMVNLLKHPKGKFGIGFGAKANFKDINIINVKGFSAGVGVGLVYDLKNKNNALVKSAIEFAKSKEWAEAVKTTGSLPPLDW